MKYAIRTALAATIIVVAACNTTRTEPAEPIDPKVQQIIDDYEAMDDAEKPRGDAEVK